MFRICFASVFALTIYLCQIQIEESNAQRTYNMLDKPGGCPPPLPRMICSDQCDTDQRCPGIQKCCRTACGGAVCSMPVTARTNITLIKPGLCPPYNSGPWYCSSTCVSDGDCRGSRKCCRNKCGAYGCKFPIQPEPPRMNLY